MDILPEIFHTICLDINKITDMRALSTVCHKYRDYCSKHIVNLESLYIEKCNKFVFHEKLLEHCIEKFIIEIILDGYDLPKKYYKTKNPLICPMFAFCGNFESLKFAYQQIGCMDKYVVSCAAYNGNVDMLSWILTLDNFIDKSCYTKFDSFGSQIDANAAAGGHVDVLNYAIQHHYGVCERVILIQAIENNHMNVIDWVLEHFNIKYKNILQNMAYHIGRYDNINCLEHLMKTKTNLLQNEFDVFSLNFIERICAGTFDSGLTNVLDWLVKKGFDLNEHFSYFCAESTIKHKKILQWILDNCTFAITSNQLESMIRYDMLDEIIIMCNHGQILPDDIYQKCIDCCSAKILHWLLSTKKIDRLNVDFNDIVLLVLGRDNLELFQWAFDDGKDVLTYFRTYTYMSDACPNIHKWIMQQNKFS